MYLSWQKFGAKIAIFGFNILPWPIIIIIILLLLYHVVIIHSQTELKYDRIIALRHWEGVGVGQCLLKVRKKLNIRHFNFEA